MSAFDEASFYEIVELENGDVALRRPEHVDEEPLLTIRFSAESNDYLGAVRYEVAKIMIEAGLDFVAEMENAAEEEGEEEPPPESSLLH
jgi:hypothetical protein